MNKKELKLYEAMRMRSGITVKGIREKNGLIIQRINLDGECDIYSMNSDLVIAYDVKPNLITVK